VFSTITLFGLCAQAFWNYHTSTTYKPEVKYDHEFVEKLRTIGNKPNVTGGFWLNESSLQNFRDTPAYGYFSEFLPCIMDKTFILNLTSIKNIRKKDYFSGTPLSWVTNELAYYAHKGEGRELFEKNEEAFYLSFLSKMNVSFLIVEEGVYLPTCFTAYFQQNYVLCKKSGSRLYIKQ
jgi:hypothetical protein